MKRAVLCLFVSCVVYGQGPDPSITFDVASVKLPPPRTFSRPPLGCSGGPGTSSPGRFACTNGTMIDLLRRAFDLKSYQLVERNLAGISLSASIQAGSTYQFGFDIVATMPVGATTEQFRTMLQNLLIERFKLKYHFESKDADVFELAIAKGGPRLKEAPADAPPGAGDAEPASRSTRARPSTDTDGCPVYEVPRGNLSQMGIGGRWCVSASAVLIDKLVDVLSNRVGGKVTDATGLKGKYDFKLSFSMARSPSAIPFGNAPMPTEGGVSELDTGPTLLGAVETQLGLKLEKKKGSIELFVIDHVEKVPTEN